ncbi:MAG: O-fucosyltransferase family protein [Syntrophomonadaceae bacterium]|nr:O-fucosyltransferase family protein [Syntrophomonadaceae bacterium]
MNEESVIERIPREDRFFLIKSTRAGFWSDMHNVWGKLLLAEITHRRPIVFWGDFSRYSVGEDFNSFEQYFLPVSDCSLGDIVNDKYTYYPSTCKFHNIYQEDGDKWFYDHRDIADFINCDANVVESHTHHCLLYDILPWVKEGHPVYGLWGDDVFRYIINKYIKLQPYITDEIEEFYHTHHMEKGPILAVHIRSTDLIQNMPHLKEINAQYPHEIDCYLKDNPSARIFLLTDDETVLEQYKQMYGDILIYTNCSKKTINGLCPFLQVFPDGIRKGIEVIKDTYLACKCDHFIGNNYSNVSWAVSRLKIWDKDRIKLLWIPMPSET